MTPPIRPEGVLSYDEWKRRQQAGPPAAPREDYGPAAGLLMSAAEGATFGLSRPIGAGLSAAAQKIGGDDRPLGDIYRGERDELRRKMDTFREDNPIPAIAANVAGALVSPASTALNAVKVARGVGPIARATNAGVQGAIAGGVAGGANTAGDESVFANTALGAGLGLAGGAAFSGIADAGKQVGRVFGLGPRTAADRGTVAAIQRRMGSETAEESGARRVATILRRENMGVGDLMARSQAAPAEDILAEQMGQRGVRGLRTARTLGNKAPTTIDDALTDRALNETSRLRRTFADLTGAERDDATTVARRAMAKVQDDIELRYGVARDVPLAPELADEVSRIVQPLDADGLGVSRAARQLGGMPSMAAPASGPRAGWDDAQKAVGGLREAYEEAMQDAATFDAYGKLVTSVDADNVRTRSPNMTAAMRRKNTMAKQRPTDEVLSRGERRELGMDLTEDARARIEEAGFSVDEYRDLVRRGLDAQRRLPGLQERLSAAEQALERAALESDGAVRQPMTLGQVLSYRQTLDALIDDNAATSLGRRVNARLMQSRDALDAIAKSGGGDRQAAQAIREADELFASAKQVGESFSTGQRAAQGGDAQAAARMLADASNPTMARRGVGNEILRRLGGIADEGRIQNPGPSVTGGEERRQITRMAFPDDATFGQFRQSVDDAGRRLGTLRAVSGGSQTADKLSDMADFATDPSIFTEMATGNVVGPLRRLAGTGIARRLSTQNAAEADALTKYLLAGAPGQMSREDAIQELVRLLPTIQRKTGNQATRRAVAGAAVTGGLVR